jgi:hypothetical protein
MDPVVHFEMPAEDRKRISCFNPPRKVPMMDLNRTKGDDPIDKLTKRR